MIAFALYVASFVAQPAPARSCEELGPRLDGTLVTVCDGRVVRVRDTAANSRVWEHDTNTVIVRSARRAPMVLGFDGR
jgi:hypothetical protein